MAKVSEIRDEATRLYNMIWGSRRELSDDLRETLLEQVTEIRYTLEGEPDK